MADERSPFTWWFKRKMGYIAGQVVPIPVPRVVEGAGAVSQIGAIAKELGISKPLIVTDAILLKLGLLEPVVTALGAAGLQHEMFAGVTPNPAAGQAEEGRAIYEKGRCDGIVAVGGGSPMDCAKIIGALVSNPKESVEQYEGLLRVTGLGLFGKLPPLIAVPTTAGTGSETTVAAVITIPEERKKINIIDPGIVPDVAVLDPQILTKLPRSVTAATGMDALTHAVEAYVSEWNTDLTRRNSLMAVEKIFQHLLETCQNGDNLEARAAMLRASFEGGVAITRASVGYVHAIAHQFGGLFHTPHGVANAMVLPHVLQFYIGKRAVEAAPKNNGNTTDACCAHAAHERSADEQKCIRMFVELAQAAGLASHYKTHTDAEKSLIAQRLVDSIGALNDKMGLPAQVPKMKAADVPVVAARALREAHGELFGGFWKAPISHLLDLGYPVPKYMSLAECQGIVAQLLPDTERRLWERDFRTSHQARL